MPLQLSEATDEADFKKLSAVAHDAYQEPFNSFWEALKGPTVEEYAVRLWSGHNATTDGHFLKVTDSETGEVVGGTEWIVHRTNPYESESPAPTATWWPEGPLKDLSDQMLQTFFGTRPTRMNRPHLLVNLCFVSQKHRRRGAGRLMMDWGCKMADEMGLECLVESTDDGKALYESVGFCVVDSFTLDAHNPSPSTAWLKLKQDILPKPYRVWFLRRSPAGAAEPAVAGHQDQP